MKLKYLRWISLAAVFIVVSLGLILNTNAGTLSSFGWQAIAAICPLGVIESMLAGKSIFLRALVVLLATVVIIVALGKFFCSWVCPVAPIRSFMELVRRRFKRASVSREGEGVALEKAACNSSEKDPSACSAHCSQCLSTCAPKHQKLDSRHLVLGGSLLSAAIFGFPVFCLLCPIGLLFGTIIVAWQFFGSESLSISLLIYPLILILELVVFRKWCSKLCPMGALLSLLSLTNRFFRPKVNTDKCLRAQGKTCGICSEVCKEELDPHCIKGMNECSKCGICKDACPTGAISFTFLPGREKGLRERVDTSSG